MQFTMQAVTFLIVFFFFFGLWDSIARPFNVAVKSKIYGVLYKQSSSIAFDETSSYWSALKSS